jgi:phosphatidylinositol glycan class V
MIGDNMLSSSLPFKPLASPRKTLLALFILWKSILLLIAVCSPGPGYDTSTTLAFEGAANDNAVVSLLTHLCTKLTRWDAIYFTKVARRGYLFEQEWAFGWGFTKWINFFASGRIIHE